MVRTMADSIQLMAHQRFGVFSRHDLVTLDGTRIPQGHTYVNVGQPDGVNVNRFAREVDIVLTEVPFEHMSELKRGMVFAVKPIELLIAVDEVAADCECPLNSRTCYNREVQNGNREPIANRPDPRTFARRPQQQKG